MKTVNRIIERIKQPVIFLLAILSSLMLYSQDIELTRGEKAFADSMRQQIADDNIKPEFLERYKSLDKERQEAIKYYMFWGDAKQKKAKENAYKAIETMCNSDYLFEEGVYYSINKSFLADLDGYKELFPDAQNRHILMTPPQDPVYFHYDKPYSTRWEIVNNTLYLIGISAIDSEGYNGMDCSAHLKVMSEFTGVGFLDSDDKDYKELEYGRQQIKATWVNGTYIVREWPDQADGFWGGIGTIPLSKIKLTIKNGEIVSREKMPNDVENLYNVEAWRAEL